MVRQSRVLVTGGAGYIGGAVVRHLASRPDLKVVAWVRRAGVALPENVTEILDAGHGAVPFLGSQSIDIVIHCAGRAHVLKERAGCALAEYRRVNVDLTISLARQAVAAGARRFIFLSTIKVHGECSKSGELFQPNDPVDPQDYYSLSKLEAERNLEAFAAESGLEVVIIRPPLVYGPGVKANFFCMMRYLHMGMPLPFRSVKNKRSLVALANLVDLIETCINHPSAANQIFLVSDGEDMSTLELTTRLAIALGRVPLLVPVPSVALKVVARVLGKTATFDRLCGSLEVDISKTVALLGWHPPVSVEEALRHAALDYVDRSSKP